MNTISKKNNPNLKKTLPLPAKPLKRSKSTEHLPSKKITKKNHLMREESEETFINAHSLAKSKSAKSVKSKQSTLHKSSPTPKKLKPKKKLSTKTLKKHADRSSNQASSILTEEWKTVKPTNEYFVYCNNYIPIENSAQRRLVYKIQMIDLENKSTADGFNHPKAEDKEIATDSVTTLETAVGDSIQQSHGETQTDKRSFEELAEKCFADVLTELEFLYLPNENNFQPFTPNERTHYGQMLEALAKKMLTGCKSQVTNNLLTEDQITVLVYQRQGIMVGALQYIPLEGFPTHLLAILAYLKNLFCFIDYSYKDQIIANIRQFYGHTYNERVSRLTRKLPHEKDNRAVLSPQIFKKFQHEMFKDYQFTDELVKQSVHIHNRAIFDSVNAELQMFRPFYSSEGEPFPWSINLGMTHYDITEEALYIIFMQIKEKIQKQIVTLCGMHLDFDDKTLPDPYSCPLYKKKMQQKIEKMVVQDLKKEDDTVAVDYQKTAFKFDIADEIFYSLISQLQKDLIIMQAGSSNSSFDFQYFF